MNIIYSIELSKNNTYNTIHEIINNVFTKHMDIKLIDTKNTIIFLINGFFRLTLNKTKLMMKIQKQNASGHIKKSNTNNTRKHKRLNNVINRNRNRTKTKNRFNKIGGGKIKNLILGVLVFFITDFFVEIQWIHSSLDTIPSSEFHTADIFKYNPDLKHLLENVDTIHLNSNMTYLDIQNHTSLLLNSKGTSLSLSHTNNLNNITKTNNYSINSILNTEEYRPAFIEIDLSKQGPTSKLIDIMENLPKKIKPYISLGPDSTGYKVFCEWKINNSDIFNIKIYNTIQDNGDTRFRNLPDMKQLNDIIKKSFEQQINIMRKTKMLSNEETYGFGELILANLFPVSTKSFDSNTDYFHQNRMSLNTHLKNNMLKFSGDFPYRKSILKQKNIKLSRPTNFDSIMTMTYSKDVIDANYRILNNTGKITNIKSSNKSGFTRIYDQSKGVEHSAKRHSRFDINTTSRNIVIMFVMPNNENNFYKKKYFIER